MKKTEIVDCNYVLTHKQVTIFFVDTAGNIETVSAMQNDDPEIFNDIRMLINNDPVDITAIYDTVHGLRKAKVAPMNTVWEQITAALQTDEIHGDISSRKCFFHQASEDDQTIMFTTNGADEYALPEGLQQKFMEKKHSLPAITSLMNFVTRLYKNPSMRSVKQAFSFLENGGFPLDIDGTFYALKNVKRVDDKFLVDIYTGSKPNDVGVTVKEIRNKISDDPKQTCSYGLHVCNHTYLSSYRTHDTNNQTIVVKVDPQNIVSVPVDYNNAKMRVCEYKVTREITSEEISDFIKAALMNTDGIFEYIFTPEYMSPEEADAFFDGYDDGRHGKPIEVSGDEQAYLAGHAKGVTERDAWDPDHSDYDDEYDHEGEEYVDPYADVDPDTYDDDDTPDQQPPEERQGEVDDTPYQQSPEERQGEIDAATDAADIEKVTKKYDSRWGHIRDLIKLS